MNRPFSRAVVTVLPRATFEFRLLQRNLFKVFAGLMGWLLAGQHTWFGSVRQVTSCAERRPGLVFHAHARRFTLK